MKSRWACLPLDFRFYLMHKDIAARNINTQRRGQSVCFESKMEQAASMLKGVFDHFQQPLLAVTDSWFGNDGLWSRLDRGRQGDFHLLSRLRTNIIGVRNLMTPLAKGDKPKRGRPRKYGERRIVAEVALDPDFQSVCPGPRQTAQNSFVKTLLRMVA